MQEVSGSTPLGSTKRLAVLCSSLVRSENGITNGVLISGFRRAFRAVADGFRPCPRVPATQKGPCPAGATTRCHRWLSMARTNALEELYEKPASSACIRKMTWRLWVGASHRRLIEMLDSTGVKAFGCVPVTHLDRLGQPSRDPVAAAPCVRVLYTFSPIQSGGSVTFDGEVWALIDTGADLSCIDHRLVAPHARVEASIRSTSLAGAGIATVYGANLCFSPVGKSFHTHVTAVPMGPERPWRMIIGRSLLRHTRFVYDRSAGIRALEVF